ncbi:hypothetical protein PHLCEN_2v11160 [Hermanssonia centrifuga]|uniref:Uncharacterized protein n=1 Tax=Hermanssonia centrifuga TaxID=98765 RepID=A0A2R6NKR6_9APHY|nr:hypothetical protein PHLCEN_2v11160 [Hermanssonia centrifuga]
MFASPAIGLEHEGSDDYCPIKLGILKREFEGWLEYLFNRDFRVQYQPRNVTKDSGDNFWENESSFAEELEFTDIADARSLEESEHSNESILELADEKETYFGIECPSSLMPLLCIIRASDILIAEPARQFAVRAVAWSPGFIRLTPQEQLTLACEASVKEWVRPACFKLIRGCRIFAEIEANDAPLYGLNFLLTLATARESLAFLLHRLAYEPPPLLQVTTCERPHTQSVRTWKKWFRKGPDTAAAISCQQKWKELWHDEVVLEVMNPSASMTTYKLKKNLRTAVALKLCPECATWYDLNLADSCVMTRWQRQMEEEVLNDCLELLGFDA